jgi:D-tagatose-1,6-bisphosphate aldolase subunit GatZ/KbaZ
MLSTPANKLPTQKLRQIIHHNRRFGAGGVYSVCSAHPWVLEVTLQQAIEEEGVVLVESTASQVNQEGGYTGQAPRAFADLIRSKAASLGVEDGRIMLGGDHLGPFPWRAMEASGAMVKARALVRACVLAGYQKIHLDASMACGNDPKGPLDPRVIAQRAASLAEAAESAYAELYPASTPPVYVIGTEVPVPGGETAEGVPPAVTASEHVQDTLEMFQSAFKERSLSAAWERVIALVVQPGVEFGDHVVFSFDHEKARGLSSALPKNLPIVYEAHSTDYQSPQALREMVEDHFAVLKVGPWLTFAFREAVFALSEIEKEVLGGNKSKRLSEVRRALDHAMVRNPVYWKSYYCGDEARQRFSRAFSYSDRCRYYWPVTEVQAEVHRLLANLTDQSLPPALISQYLPFEYEAYRNKVVVLRCHDLIRHHIRRVLQMYSAACHLNRMNGDDAVLGR